MSPAVGGFPDGMVAAQARIAALQARLSGRPVAGGTFGKYLSAATSAEASSTLTSASVSAPASASVLTGAGTVGGEKVVALAKEQLGVPYIWGAEDPSTGFDCSGLVQYVYGQVGVELPRVSSDQARAGEPVASLADARPGDLVAFGSPVDHIGIYAGDGKMVVAPHRGDVVKVQEIKTTPTAIRRILPDVGLTSTSAGTKPSGAGNFQELFAAAGARHGVSPALLASVAKAESGFDPTAVSRAGARGLMQLMPATASSLGVDPLDPAQAVDGAARLLKSHITDFGSTELALAAYNAGPGAVRRYGGVPPYSETQTYVRRVMAGMQGGTSTWN